MRIQAFFLCFMLLAFPGFFYADHPTVYLPDDASNNRFVVNIGLIAEMGSWEGNLVRSFVSMALNDFRRLNQGTGTRVALHVRDSMSIADALDLLENVKVQAIIALKMSNEEMFLARLADAFNVPLLSLSSLSPSVHLPYFIQVAEDEVNQFHGIAALVKAFEWRSFVFLHEDAPNARYIHDIFEENHLDIAHRIPIFDQTTDDQIIHELDKAKATKSSLFVLHLSPSLSSRVFTIAKMLGMMRTGFAWIVTSKVMNFLESWNSSLCEPMQGALGFKSYVPDSSKLQNLTMRWRKEFEQRGSTVEARELSLVGLWAYDAAWALALTIDKLDISRTKILSIGPSILSKITDSRFTGLAGEFHLTNKKLVRGAYEIRNILCNVERRVGFWTSTYGLTKDLLSHDVLSSDNLSTVIWPGLPLTTPPQRRLAETSRKRFRVVIPANVRFPELVDVRHDIKSNTTTYGGFCMDVFHAAFERLGHNISPEYILFDNENGSYNDLVSQVYLQNMDAAVGDITILANRSENVDFTAPFSDLGVGLMVKLENDPWFFLKPLSPALWTVSACSFVVMGSIVWLIEHPINEEFQGSLAQQIGAVLWFSVSTLVYANRERLRSNASRFIVGVWFFVVLILTSSYIANLSSLLTVAQFKYEKSHYIGYSANSYVRRMVDNLNFGDDRLKPYQSPEQYYDALTKGSKHGGVDAILEEVPYIKALIARNPGEYAMVKSSSKTSGFGFAFPKGSSMVHEMSRAIAELREEGKLLEMENEWFKYRSVLSDDDIEPPKLTPLNIHQFTGLFLINGVSEAVAVIAFIAFLVREKLVNFSFPWVLCRGKLMGILKYFYPEMDNRIPGVNAR